MFRILISLLLALIGFGSLKAQTQDIDEVRLLDDRIFHGKVVEQKPGEYIKLALLNSSDTLTFTMDEIDKLLRVPSPNTALDDHGDPHDASDEMNAIKKYNSNPVSLYLKGSAGGGDVAFQGLGLGVLYRVNPRLTLGLEALYLGETSNHMPRPYQWQKIPVSVQARYDIQQHFGGRSAIFAKLDLGHSFTINGDYSLPDGSQFEVSNGVVFSPGLGYRFNAFKNVGATIDVSYHLISDRLLDEEKNVVRTHNWDNIIISATIFF